MSGKRQGLKTDEVAPQSSPPSEGRTASHPRFKLPSLRRETSSDPDSWLGGMPPPSTLPPAPFEREADVSGHEWWLDAHMSAASNVLCLEQLVDGVMEDADVLAVDRIRALIVRLGDVRDALYELYCDAADPRMHGRSTPDGALTGYITKLYAWCELVNEKLALVTTGMRTSAADWRVLAPAYDAEPSLFAEDARRSVRASIHELGVDFASHVEPLRNLPKDVEQMFLSAITLRAEIDACTT
jgi:hypothetical protein